MARASGIVIWLSALSLSACSSSGIRVIPPPADSASLWPMELVIEDPVGVSSLGELPMSGKGRNAADSAAIAFLGMTAAGAAGGPYGLAVGAALGLVLAPIAAIGGAIHGTDTVQPETWEANRNILAAITDGHWAEKLRSEVMAKLRDQQRLAAESDMSATRFGLWFEPPWLVIDGDDAIPTLTLHGEL